MKRIMLSILALLIVAGAGSELLARGKGGCGACPGYGDGMRGGYGYHWMMRDRLGLTEEQELKIHKINKDYADKFFEARKDPKAMDNIRENHRKEVEKVLTKEQLDKMKDFRGPRDGKGKGKERFCDYGDGMPGMMHSYLNITDEQAEKIHKLNMEFRDKMFKERNNPEGRDKLRENHRKELEKILTKDQLKKLEDFRKNHRGMRMGPDSGWEW